MADPEFLDTLDPELLHVPKICIMFLEILGFKHGCPASELCKCGTSRLDLYTSLQSVRQLLQQYHYNSKHYGVHSSSCLQIISI